MEMVKVQVDWLVDKVKRSQLRIAQHYKKRFPQKNSNYCVDRVFGYFSDYNVHVAGGQNFAYQGMRVKYGEILLDKEMIKVYCGQSRIVASVFPKQNF